MKGKLVTVDTGIKFPKMVKPKGTKKNAKKEAKNGSGKK